MQELISLTDLVTRQKIAQISIVDQLDIPTNKISKLYLAITNNEIKTDEDALNILYDGQQKKYNLKKIKNRLYERLINSTFFLDQSGPNYDDIFKAGITCYKNYAAIRILMSNRKQALGAGLAEKTYRISRKYEFTDLNYLLSSLLSIYYTSNFPNHKKKSKFKDLREYYFLALKAEGDAELLYSEFNSRLSISSSSLNAKELNECQAIVDDLMEKQQIIKTLRFNLFTYLYIANFYLETRRYEEIIDMMVEGLKFYSDKKFKSIDGEYFLKTRGGIASFMLKQYEKAEQLFRENLLITSRTTLNWYATQKYLFSLKVIQKDYQSAYDITSIVLNSKNFEKNHPLIVQLFKIYEAYIHFLVELGKIDPSKSDERELRKFRLSRFLNDVPTYSKDKRGVNISILVIQMILLVQNKKHGAVIDRLDALNMYSHRYLRSDNTFRSNCFIKMLAKLPDADYHPIRWQRYVEKYRKRLDDHPFELSYHNLDLEVIPFETLYDLVIEMLEQQNGRKR